MLKNPVVIEAVQMPIVLFNENLNVCLCVASPADSKQKRQGQVRARNKPAAS